MMISDSVNGAIVITHFIIIPTYFATSFTTKGFLRIGRLTSRWSLPQASPLLALCMSSYIALTDLAYVIYDVHRHDYTVGVPIDAMSAAIWGFLAFNDWHRWKNNRKDRKKALKALGEKSRAALEKLKSSMPKPSLPRLRPAPVPV